MNEINNVSSITFDEDDKVLFGIDDLQLKADAIHYSLLPKLEIIGSELVSRIIAVYGVDYFSHSSFAKSPSFRKSNRIEELKTDYDSATISLKGQRKWEKWFGLKRVGEKPANIVPFSLTINLSEDGLSHGFYFTIPRNFTLKTYRKFFNFLIDNESLVQALLFNSELIPLFEWNEENLFISAFSEKLKWKLKNGFFDLFFVPAHGLDFPIGNKEIEAILSNCTLIYALYQCFIDISLGKKTSLQKYVEKYNMWLLANRDKEANSSTGLRKIQLTADEIEKLTKNKLKVQAGLRWLVFKRDDWKCVSCGRSSADGIILHIDHILPRSKGGKDVIENYQTLCNICNIGKSNKDATDLRKRKSK